ncbi:4Fe-4S binding protein [Humidesulfovibrio idahonensis]
MDKLNSAMAKASPVLTADELREICMEAGAADCGFVELSRPALDFERQDIIEVYPRTKTLIALAFALNPENMRSSVRNMSSSELHEVSDESARAERRILRRLNAQGVRGVAVPADFPMDMGRFPGKIWHVSHKIVAVEAGLGHMGLNRLVLHPRLGSFIRLTTLLVDAEVDVHGAPLKDSPCIGCGLCAAVCPVGAVRRDGSFDLTTCMVHAYRDNIVGFLDFIDSVTSAPDLTAFRQRFMDRETASLWQSLMYKMNYRCGYCMAVCPAGLPGGADYAGDRKTYMAEVFRPLRDRHEEIYVIAGSTAEERASKNPNKQVRRVAPKVERRA